MARRAWRVCVAALVVGCGAPASQAEAGGSDPAQALSRDPVPGFARITESRPFEFPADYGPHPETQTEWWYVTGNLEDESGRAFGYQFTVFRLGVVPAQLVADSSAWAVGDLYMAHVALTDIDGGRFAATQRLARPALGIAGAELNPFRVWLEGWELKGPPGEAFFPLQLSTTTTENEGHGGAFTLDLTLESGKDLVLHGDRGYSRKGADAGDASHYYSFTRIPTSGSVTINGDRYTVTGDSWLDREWSTSVLSRTQRGWDWFSLQLEDGRDVMLFELRSSDPATAVADGTVIQADGATTRLEPQDFDLEVVDHWVSPVDGSEYPSAWRLQIPDHGIDLEIRAAVADQEHTGLFRYWEGAVVLNASDGSAAGRGFAELTGYSAQPN